MAVLGVLDEELHAPDAASAQLGGDGRSHGLGLLKQVGLHHGRLPALLVIAPLLAVTDGRAKERVACVLRQGEQGDFVVELDEGLHDDFGQISTRAFQGVVPRLPNVGLGADDALALAGTGHQGLDYAGHAHGIDASLKPFQRRRVLERRGLQPQVHCREVADGPPVHGVVGRLGRRHDADALLLVVVEPLRADGLHLRHHDVRLVLGDDRVEGVPVEHGNHLKVVGHLHGWRAGIRVHRDDVLAEPLEGDDDFFSELARAEEHDFLLHGRKLAWPPCRVAGEVCALRATFGYASDRPPRQI